MITSEIKGIATSTIAEYPEVLDASVAQDGTDVSLFLVVAPLTSETRAQELGDNFVRMVKTFSQDEVPGKIIGAGRYNYLVTVAYPGGETIAQGAKPRVAESISW